MEFLLAAFGMPIFAAMAVIIESHLSNRTFKHPTTMVFYVSISNALFLPLLLFLGTPTMPSPEVWGCYLILAAIYIGYLYPYYLAMKVIDPSIVAALFALGQVSVPLLSYFWLGDKLDFAQYVGFAVIILSSVALSIKGRKIPKLNRAFYYMVLASLLVAFAEVLKKYTLIEDLSWINLAIFPGAISGMIPLAFLLVKPWRKDIVRNFPPYLKKCRLFVVNEFICFLGMVRGLCFVRPVAGDADFRECYPADFYAGIRLSAAKEIRGSADGKDFAAGYFEKNVLLYFNHFGRDAGDF